MGLKSFCPSAPAANENFTRTVLPRPIVDFPKVFPGLGKNVFPAGQHHFSDATSVPIAYGRYNSRNRRFILRQDPKKNFPFGKQVFDSFNRPPSVTAFAGVLNPVPA